MKAQRTPLKAPFDDGNSIHAKPPANRALTFTAAPYAIRCSLCDHERRRLVTVASDGGRGVYCFCSVCIRAMGKALGR